ncbi:MAG: response regulator transcription factor [Ruminococcus sp.]|nr:response regulator transcription factor [Ruminococcus sp.]
MNKILVAEDDAEINRIIRDYLDMQGYETISAANGLDAVRLATEHPELSMIILDIMLPFQSGDTVLKKIRSFSQVPVIIVSAKSTVQSKIDLLRLGADDYLTKPFDLDELLIRIETVLRRTAFSTEKTDTAQYKYKNLLIDAESKTAYVNDVQLVLTSKEYSILELLLKNPTKLFSKANLFESVWETPYFNDDNIIKVHISNLRSKIKKIDPDEEYIDTIWGMGYKLSPNDPDK